MAHYHITVMPNSFHDYIHRQTQKDARTFKNTVLHLRSYPLTSSFFRDFSANFIYFTSFALTKKSGAELHKTDQLKHSPKFMKCMVIIINPLTCMIYGKSTYAFSSTRTFSQNLRCKNAATSNFN